MSYNLLADSLVKENPQLYRMCNPRVLQWENRSLILLKELEKQESHTIDIYCFQELDQFDYDTLFKEKFAQWGYTGVYKKRNGDKYDGCAMFYRNQSVNLVSIATVDYHQNAFIDRDNIGIVGLFDIKQGTQVKRVCVATTHILFNPKRGMIKIAQLRMLLEKAKELIDNQKNDIPFKGVDVSTIPESHMSGQFKGKIPIGHWRSNITGFHEAFNQGNHLTVVTEEIAKKEVCDYIFYGHLKKVPDSQASPKLELVACLELPCKSLEDERGLPTDNFGSDHLSLVSKFRFT
ncbi:hypothetical protein BGZ65_012971 [Modicella reniformis]|uniref:Endonuclease/exonuclease/phosphatase domain-containing protein n=1 Tax=Modicella reniformis TaxID=1440133 RepID=A0A9P6MJV2_9FUNG|nr:hypothetical protein BGZ65_012971 [Modicella reniformis]